MMVSERDILWRLFFGKGNHLEQKRRKNGEYYDDGCLQFKMSVLLCK